MAADAPIGPGPGPDEDAVAAWLQRLARKAAALDTERDPAGEVGDAVGPIELTPLPADDDADREPNARAYFHDLLRALRRPSRSRDKRVTDLWTVVTRNCDRYLRFNRRRLAYLYQGLRAKNRATFSAIPYLLHVNQSGLPGFVGAERVRPPWGISNFDQNETIQAGLRELFPAALRGTPPAMSRPAIRAVMIMGSVGTIGHSGHSDIDYWVVVDEDKLGSAEQKLLVSKIEGVERWAKSRGLDVHFFVVDAARARDNDFGRGSTDSESSGTAQGKLLKEEFYRTGIYLSGQLPFWWAVPLGINSGEYDKMLTLLRAGPDLAGLSFVDLGFIGRIDRGEFFGAALWQINKSLANPFKSLLKMALLARYMDDERPRLLCSVLKQRVFEGEREPQFTDPYVLLFDAISEYFAGRRDWAAFRLVQKCFYLKVGLKLSREKMERAEFLQRFRVMRAFITRWGWDRALLEDLDTLDQWTAERVNTLGQEIRSFMLGLYRHLIERARETTARIDEEDVTILGRRLYACFGDEPGKIPHLFTYFLKEPRVEERVVILEVPSAPSHRRWEIHRSLRRGEVVGRDLAMRHGADLAQVGAWLTFNGLFASETVVGLISSVSRTSIAELRTLLERFCALFASPDPFNIPPATFLVPRRVARVALVINFDLPRTPEDATAEAGVYFLPENWDILNYGRKRQSQVRHISVVTLNSWGEMFCTRHIGERALGAAMASVFGRLDPDMPLEHAPEVLAPQGRELQAVRNRLGRILDAVHHVWLDPLPREDARAFAYEVSGRFQIFWRDADRRRVGSARGLRGVARQLGCLGANRCEVSFDHLSPPLAPLKALLERRRQSRDVQVVVGWTEGRDRARIFVHDERGRVHFIECAVDEREKLLNRVVRRVVYHLRRRVRSALGLRRALHVFELGEGRNLADPVAVIDETGRVLERVGQMAWPKPELWLKGDLRRGRDGVYLQWGNEVFAPDRQGRAFSVELVRKVLAERSLYDASAFFIAASDVVFGPRYSLSGADEGVVKHLRLIELYERLLACSVDAFRGVGSRRRFSSNPFSNGGGA